MKIYLVGYWDWNSDGFITYEVCSTWETAVQMKDELDEKYPDKSFEIEDWLTA